MSDKAQEANSALSNLGTLLPDLESVYKDIHSHPELSMQENRTAGIAADRLRAAGYEVATRVGQTGKECSSVGERIRRACSNP